MENPVPTALTTSDWERSAPRTMTCLMGLGLVLSAPTTLVPFPELAVRTNPYDYAVSARNDLQNGHEPFGTSLSVVDSPAFDNFITTEEATFDPKIAFSYVTSMAVLPIDEAAEVEADKYFATKEKKPRKVVISTRA